MPAINQNIGAHGTADVGHLTLTQIADQMYGNEGDDYLFANDGEQDTVDGGDGIDTADADGLDILFNFP